jgi:hypothetical protein
MQYGQSGGYQEDVPVWIGVRPLFVYSSVDLDNQLGRMAVKIDDESADDMLSAEMKAQ